MEEYLPELPLASVPASVPVPASASALAYPTLKESWAVVGWFLLISLLTGIVLLVPVYVIWPHSAPKTELWATAVVSGLSLLLTILWLRRRAGAARWPERDTPPSRAGWGSYALLPVLVVAGVVVLSPLHLLHLPDFAAGMFTKMAAMPVLLLAMGCVAAPLLEEFLFRRVILEGLLRSYSPAVAIGQSALLFGVFHFNLAQSVAAVGIGLLLGWLYYRTRSLALCIGFHALNNLLAFWSMQPNAPQFLREEPTSLPVGTFAVTYLVAGLVLAGALWLLERTRTAPVAAASAG